MLPHLGATFLRAAKLCHPEPRRRDREDGRSADLPVAMHATQENITPDPNTTLNVSRKRFTHCEVSAPPVVAVPSARLGMTSIC